MIAQIQNCAIIFGYLFSAEIRSDLILAEVLTVKPRKLHMDITFYIFSIIL